MPGHPIISIIGAGSINWGRQIAIDLMLDPTLDGAEIRLMDIDRERLDLVHRYLAAALAAHGWRKTLAATCELDTALRGATHLITGISVGGDHLWRFDAMFPQIWGIYQAVGDTVGPGGAIRALRHAPPMMRIARTLAQVGAPGATVLQVTNPMNVLCGAMSRVQGIQVLGFCHGFDDTENIIARALGVPRPEVSVKLAGNNHFIAADEITVSGRAYDQAGIRTLFPRLADGVFREMFFHRYGVYVGNYQRHPAEFVPGFLTREHGFGRTWDIAPIAGEVDPANPSRQDDAMGALRRTLDDAAADPAALGASSWRIAASREPLNRIISALHHGTTFATHLNVANQGAIAGVADAANIEVHCTIANRRIERRRVAFPSSFTAEVARVAHEQELLARACESYDEDLMVEALLLDALVPKDRDAVRRMVRAMVAYQSDLILAPTR
jgi:alpha-galactosidase